MIAKVEVKTNISMNTLWSNIQRHVDESSIYVVERLYRETTAANQQAMGQVFTDTIVNNMPGQSIRKWDGKSDIVMLWWFHKPVSEWIMSQLQALAPEWPWEKKTYKPEWAVDSDNPPKYKASFETSAGGFPIQRITEADEVVEIYNLAVYGRRLEPDWGNAMVKKGQHVKVPMGVMTTVAEAAKARYSKAARVMFTFEDYKSDRYPVIKIRLPRSVLAALRR